MEEKEPYYDVVICVKDMEQFISETILNLQSSYLPPRTIWVIDDGSSDNTAQEARKHNNVEVIENFENKGKSYSRNVGITRSKAPFIQLIDADDLIAAEKTVQQMDYLIQNAHVDAVYGDVQHFIDSENGRVYREPITYSTIPDMLEQLIKKNIYALHSFLFRRSYFDKAGLFDERLVTSQDRELWIRALISGCEVHYKSGNIAYYRRHETSTIASQQQTVAYFNALAVELHANTLFYFKNNGYREVTRQTLRMLARNSNRYLRSFTEIDQLIQKAYSVDTRTIQLEQNAIYNTMEGVFGGKITERILRFKFILDHKMGRYGIKY
ncbi:glycosyltransferase [bacterium]|nr:MAG: glycosyltransferase [bacterium]